jgi:methylenetetrahydrofolate reductase (NADPH)
MQLIRDIYAAKAAAGRPVISLEFFPPKTEEGERSLMEKTIPALLKGRPDYCSVTYGAGGGTRDKTLRIVDRIQREHGLTGVAHLTCVNSTREEIGDLLTEIRDLGVRNVLALRGDPPDGKEFKPTPGGFEFSSQLVRFIREQEKDFCIGVAGFPEGHIACREGKHIDWQRLRDKINAGADYVLTQLFFDNADYFEFLEHMTRRHGIGVPLVPGIIPILSASQIKRFTSLCGARIPAPLARKLEELGADDAATMEFGIDYATQQCRQLLDRGVPGIHFYTLNRAGPVLRILENLGVS